MPKQFVEGSSYLTVEALASEIVKQCFKAPNLANPEDFEISIELAKPAAIRHADAPVISLTRSFSDFPELGQSQVGVGVQNEIRSSRGEHGSR